MTSVKEKLAAARRPERVVPVYLVDLRDQITDLESELGDARAARGDRANPGPDERRIAGEIKALEQQMEDGRLDVRLRAMSRAAWRQILTDYPPRKLDDGTVVDEDAMGVNNQTFFPALIRASVIDPVFDEDDWKQLLDEALSPRQFDDLSNAAWGINRNGVSVPLSLAASRTLQSSAPE